MQQIFYNKDLFTNILSYLGNNREIRKTIESFRNMIHYDFIRFPTQMLLYGQVQSGKTSKIMDYITNYKSDKLKILVIQNNTLMLSQYVKTLSQRGITYKIINSNATEYKYNKERVLITINNKYRICSLNNFVKHNKISNYSLILDESDQYLNRIASEHVFKSCKDVLHVTATPFIYAAHNVEIDRVIRIKPKLNYIGMNQVNLKQINMYENNGNNSIRIKIKDIINEDFVLVKEGLMLINCFSKVADMKRLALMLTNIYINMPIIIFSSKTYMYLNGSLQATSKVKNIQQFTDKFANISHAIFIAGRLSNRGINYTNTNYSRNITHQISLGSGNYTTFIQKCRIFGNRTNDTGTTGTTGTTATTGTTGENIRPTIYCIIKRKKYINFVSKLMNKFSTLNTNEPLLREQIPEYDITVKKLRAMCKENKITKYSKLKKNELIDLLTKNKVNIMNW